MGFGGPSGTGTGFYSSTSAFLGSIILPMLHTVTERLLTDIHSGIISLLYLEKVVTRCTAPDYNSDTLHIVITNTIKIITLFVGILLCNFTL